jgi:hypothetical protein
MKVFILELIGSGQARNKRSRAAAPQHLEPNEPIEKLNTQTSRDDSCGKFLVSTRVE